MMKIGSHQKSVCEELPFGFTPRRTLDAGPDITKSKRTGIGQLCRAGYIISTNFLFPI